MKPIKRRSLAVVAIITAGGFGLALPAHSQVALTINGVQGTTETVCSQINILFGAADCTYGGTKAGTLNGWYGPSQGAAYYAVGSTGDSATYTPVPGDARIAVPVSGTLTITGTGAGATIGGTFIIGAAARNVALNPPARAVQRWSSITHTLATTSVTTATVNAEGGFDYVVASRGAPQQICLAGGGACFGSQQSAPDPISGPANGWGVGVGGTKPNVGIENIEYLAGITATGTTDQRNFGATTTAVIADPSCTATPVQAVCIGVGGQSINLWAPTGSQDPGYNNLILAFSTNAAGNITAGRAWWTQNFRFGLEPGQPPGDDSEQMGTFTFAGAAPTACADFAANVLVDSTNNAIDAAASCNNPGSTITIVTGPSNGAASVSGTNQITYTPIAGFEGTDTITYNGADDFSSDDGLLTISVTSNLLPEAPDGTIAVSTQGVAPQTVTGTLNVALLPGYSAGNAPAPIVSVTQGAQGAVTFLGTTLTYAPNPSAFAGTDTFTYSIEDNNGDVAQGTVTVNSPNLVPGIENGAITTEEEAASAPFLPVVIAGNGLLAQHTLAVTTNGANGSCTLTAPNGSGQVVYTPDADFSGTDACVLTLTDGNGDSDTATLSVTVEEDPIVSFSGGSSALDPWSLALLAGLPLWRRRRLALTLAGVAAAGLAVSGVLPPVVANAATREDDDRIHQGLYVGAGVNGTSLQSDLQSQDLADSLGVSEVNGQAEDFPLGGQLYQGFMFNSRWGIEGRWSATADGKTDIVSQLGDGDEQKIGSGEFSLEGWTVYGVANWPVRPHWDVFAKLGYTDQTLDSQLSVDGAGSESGSDSDNGMAAALGARWRFARHWAVMAEGEYLDVDFNGGLDEPWRAGLNLEYWFGRYEPMVAAPAVAMAAVAAPEPLPPPAAPQDSDGDGVFDAQDQCPETPRGDRVGAAGCSCDVTRQLQFEFGSAELTDADRQTLDEMAANLTRLRFVSGTIEGHTDNVGSDAFNQGLSERRAKTVAEYLQSKGIAGDRMQVVGRGESDPVGDNKTAEGRAMNRRVVARRTDCEK